MKVRPHHILVQYEYEANDIHRLLLQGKSFEELAKKYSQCPSRAQGGDLGEVDSRRLDEGFLEAYQQLKPGSFSKPVKTRFGWHLLLKAT